MSRNNTIYIFHETGAKSHYRALIEHEKKNGDIRLVFREFSVIKLLVKGLLKFNFDLVLKQIHNVIFILSLAFTSNKKIIVGITPYDWRLIFYYYLIKKHKYYYHTSKTSWVYQNISRKFLAKTDYIQKIWKKFIEKANGVFCVTKTVAKELEKKYYVEHISVVNHAINTSYSLDKFVHRNNKTIKCLFVGRLTESKGINLIFNIVDQINSNKFKFTFVGNGKLSDDVEGFVAEERNCNYLGYLNDLHLRSIYDKHDILLVPSLRTGPWEELFGMVIIEAMSRGVVPITTDHTGPKEILGDKFAKYILKEDIYVLGTNRLLMNLYDNRSIMNELKQNAFSIGQEYRPEKIFKKWNQILKITK